MRYLLPLLLLCSVLLTPAVLAQEADLQVTSVTLDKTTVTMGEPFSYVVGVRNNGPDFARRVVVHLNAHSGAFPLSMDVPSGWTCRRYLTPRTGAVCSVTGMAANTEVAFRATVLAPRNTAAWAMTIWATAVAETTDSNRGNNERSARFTLLTSSNEADLGVEVTPRGGVREGGKATVDVAVTNLGPGNASNLAVAIDTRGDTPLADLTASGPGWTCTPSLRGVLCRAATLAATTSSVITAQFTAPQHEAEVDVTATVQAEMSRDPNFRNDLATGFAGVGSPESWRRILLPLAREYAPGANGARWRTRTTMLIRSPQALDIRPGPCDRIVDPCFPLPLETPFDIGPLIYTQGNGGQFLYVRPGDEDKLFFNTRIYDEARLTQTAGAEIPVVREHELRTTILSLNGIPLAPQYRHTLRVYDADARADARVLIHVYAGAETTPRASVVRSLARSPETFELTSARLPSHPGYLELNPRELVALDGVDTFRIEVEPVDAGLRFWAFVSVTNNETHHVTTVTPQ